MEPRHDRVVRQLCRQLKRALGGSAIDAGVTARRLFALRCLRARGLAVGPSPGPGGLPAAGDLAREFEAQAAILPMVFRSLTPGPSPADAERGDVAPGLALPLSAGLALPLSAGLALPLSAGLALPLSAEPERGPGGEASTPEVRLAAALDLLRAPELDEVARQPDALAWFHQAWHRDEGLGHYRRALSAPGEKVTGREVIAATRLYTPRPIARFLVESSLGALWAAMRPRSPLVERLELLPRGACRRPVEARPAASLTVLDPACGAGCLLLAAFDLLFEMHLDEEAPEPPEAICRTILGESLYGVDLDGEALAIAEASLRMRAAERCGSWPRLEVNLERLDTALDRPGPVAAAEFLEACPEARPHRAAVERVMDDLAQLDEVGSLARLSELGEQPWLGALLGFAAARLRDRGAAARTARALAWLARRHDVVVANPPYLSDRQMGDRLRAFVQRAYRATARDLYACFLARLEGLTAAGGFHAAVSPQGWATLRSFAGFRRGYLSRNLLSCVVSLGQHAFPDAELLYVGLHAAQRVAPAEGDRAIVAALHGGPEALATELADLCRRADPPAAPQLALLNAPGSAVTRAASPGLLELVTSPGATVGERADVVAGIDTGDNARFVRARWEVRGCGLRPGRFVPYSKGKGYRRWAAPSPWVIDWDGDGERVKRHPGSTIRNAGFHFRAGLECSYVYGGKVSARRLPPSILDHGSIGVFAHDPADEPVILALLNSRLGTAIGRALSPTLNLPVGCVARFPMPAPPPGERAALDRVRVLARECAGVAAWIAARTGPIELQLGEEGAADPPWPGPAADRWALDREAAAAVLLLLEAACERALAAAFGLEAAVLDEVFEALGAPAGAAPAVEGADSLPPLPSGAGPELAHAWDLAAEIAAGLERAAPGPAARARLAALLTDASPGRPRGPGASRGRARLPPASFVERAAAAVELNPVTAHAWLREIVAAGRGWRAARAEAAIAWASAAVLSPGPASRSASRGGWPRGVIPVACWPDEHPLLDAVRARAGDDADELEAAFEDAVGRRLGWWLEERFFRVHVRRSGRRPVLWHLGSSPAAGVASRLVSCLVDARALDGETLPALRAFLDGPFRARLGRAGLERCDELDRFVGAIGEVIERGFEPEGPAAVAACEARYLPDPADGVRCNVAPLERAGVLVAPVLGRDGAGAAIADRARARGEARGLSAGRSRREGSRPAGSPRRRPATRGAARRGSPRAG